MASNGRQLGQRLWLKIAVLVAWCTNWHSQKNAGQSAAN